MSTSKNADTFFFITVDMNLSSHNKLIVAKPFLKKVHLRST